jgi:hypothetical protein
MKFVNFLISHPYWFWIVAIIWSVIQGYAGNYYGLYIYKSAYERNGSPRPRLKPCVQFFAYRLPHILFYFVCSMSGFVALYLAYLVSVRICNWSEVASGTGAILIALAVFSVLGVSGALPRILYLGNRPI